MDPPSWRSKSPRGGILNFLNPAFASRNSIEFYRRVLGFELIQRPASLDCIRGAWMHKYGVGIHLLQRSAGCDAPPRSPPAAINPKGNHVSFQCSDMALTKARLCDMDLEVVTARVWDGETTVEQLFFHDPDGNVIEICNCQDLPVVPLAEGTVQINVHL